MASAYRRWMYVSLVALGLLAETLCVQVARGGISRTCCYVIQRLACSGCTKLTNGKWAGKYAILKQNVNTRCGNNGNTSTPCDEITQVCSVLKTGTPLYNSGCQNKLQITSVTKATSFSLLNCPLNCISSIG